MTKCNDSRDGRIPPDGLFQSVSFPRLHLAMTVSAPGVVLRDGGGLRGDVRQAIDEPQSLSLSLSLSDKRHVKQRNEWRRQNRSRETLADLLSARASLSLLSFLADSLLSRSPSCDSCSILSLVSLAGDTRLANDNERVRERQFSTVSSVSADEREDKARERGSERLRMGSKRSLCVLLSAFFVAAAAAPLLSLFPLPLILCLIFPFFLSS